jgi:hypothetical protein
VTENGNVKWAWVKTWFPIIVALLSTLITVVVYAQNLNGRIDRQGDELARLKADNAGLCVEVRELRKEIYDMDRRNTDAHQLIIIKLGEIK